MPASAEETASVTAAVVPLDEVEPDTLAIVPVAMGTPGLTAPPLPAPPLPVPPAVPLAAQPLPVPTGKASTVWPISRVAGAWPALRESPTSTLPAVRLLVAVVMAGVSRVPAGIWAAAKTPVTRFANCHAT